MNTCACACACACALPTPAARSGLCSGHPWILLLISEAAAVLLLQELIPCSQNRQSADIARRRRSTARLQTDARPLREGSEQFGSGTQAYTAKFDPAAWSWAQMTSGSGAPKRVLSEGTITFKRLGPNRSPKNALKPKLLPFYPHQRNCVLTQFLWCGLCQPS